MMAERTQSNAIMKGMEEESMEKEKGIGTRTATGSLVSHFPLEFVRSLQVEDERERREGGRKVGMERERAE